jgi:hypothetical protein
LTSFDKMILYSNQKCTVEVSIWNHRFTMTSCLLWRKYKNVTITLQKDRENPLKLGFCSNRGKNVIYVSTRGHWDCTTLQHHCTTFGFASGYTEGLQGGTISMPTGRHVDNLYYLFTMTSCLCYRTLNSRIVRLY